MIQMRNIILAFILFCLASTSNCFAQTKSAPVSKKAWYTLSKAGIRENIHLHINSTFFLIGESILFKAYCTDSSNKPLNFSRILNVELIDENGFPALRTKIQMDDGNGFGDFFLPSTLVSGNYTLIAYTNWMRNFSKEDFFRAQIAIINPFKKSSSLSSDGKAIMEFFPEGGKLVAGMTNTIGFKISPEKLKVPTFTGKVVDESGNEIVSFAPSFQGMGKFDLHIAPGKEYKAIIIDSLQNVYFNALPQVEKVGSAVHVTELDDEYQIQIRCSPIKELDSALVFVRQKSKLIAKAKVKIKNDEGHFEIKKKLLPIGVSKILILDPDSIVVAERSLFRSLENKTQCKLLLDKRTFTKREKVSMSLSLDDTLTASLSISVRKVDKKIPSSFHLCGNEEYKKIDILIHDSKLANNLQKSDNPIAPHKMKYIPEIRGNLISGTVTKNIGIPAVGVIVYLSIASKQYYFSAAITDSSGRFYFNTEKVKTSSEAILQIDSTACPDCKISPERNGLNDYSSFVPNKLSIDTTFKRLIEQRSLYSQVENAYYEAKRDSILDKIMPDRFFGKSDIIYQLDNYVRFPTMEDIFIEYIGEIVLRKKDGKYDVKVKDVRRSTAFDKDPLILIDGIPIFDISEVMNYNPLLVEMIEIVGKHYYYGPIETFGIISICTYEGIAKNLVAKKNVKHVGVQSKKKYFSPIYNAHHYSLERTPDDRIQLYWNPSVMISNKPITLEFFTSDVIEDYEIVGEGIDSKGKDFCFTDVIHVK